MRLPLTYKLHFRSLFQVFGLIQGEKVAVLIDSSNANMGFGRAIEIQDALLVSSKKTKKALLLLIIILFVFSFYEESN